MRLDVQSGKLIADNEDYRIERGVIHEADVGDLTTFRYLTEDGKLCCAAIDKAATEAQKMNVAMYVRLQAKQHEVGATPSANGVPA